jgi:uncharacterized protein YlxP (DUF503 family)
MLVGVLQLDLLIPESNSLKSKRFVLNSLKAKIRNKFNVSVAEVANNDKWQRASLGISMITNERRFVDKTTSGILNLIDRDGRVEVLNQLLEVF